MGLQHLAAMPNTIRVARCMHTNTRALAAGCRTSFRPPHAAATHPVAHRPQQSHIFSSSHQSSPGRPPAPAPAARLMGGRPTSSTVSGGKSCRQHATGRVRGFEILSLRCMQHVVMPAS